MEYLLMFLQFIGGMVCVLVGFFVLLHFYN
jgi:hypothetical protein